MEYSSGLQRPDTNASKEVIALSNPYIDQQASSTFTEVALIEVGSKAASESRIAEFSRIAQESRNQMRRLAVRIVGSGEDADDIVQQALLKAFLNLPNFRGNSQLKTWLCAIVRNVALETLRSRRARVFVPLDRSSFFDGEREESYLPEPASNPESSYACREEWELLSAILTKVSPTSRRVFEMCIFEDCSQLEVAASLNLSLAKVKSRMFRIRRALRRERSKCVDCSGSSPVDTSKIAESASTLQRGAYASH